jgi:hypothetical protein
MRKIVHVIICCVLTAAVAVSCSKDNEQDTNQYPGGGGGGGNNNSCDTVNMKYATNIKPILETNCYGCHGNGLSNGNVTLDNHAGVKAVADNGKLIGVVTHAAGFPAMPQGSAKLSACNINKIKGWIDRGAPNN